MSGEPVWSENGFFGEPAPDLRLEKRNAPENALLYVNQGYLPMVKSGELAMCNHNFIIGQIIPAANQPDDIVSYECSPNEVKLLTCIYDLTTSDFKGVRESLAYIVLRGDKEEVFLSYGYDVKKGKIQASKQKIPDSFTCTCFNKHYAEIVNEKREREKFSTVFYFLPSTAHRKETINQWKENVNLKPYDFTVEFIESFSNNKVKFNPALLNSSDKSQRDGQVEMLHKLFKHMAIVSNQNLIRNVDYLNVRDNRGSDEMDWSVGGSNKRFDSAKFKLTY